MSGYGYNAVATALLTIALLPLAVLPLLGTVVRRYGALRGLPLLHGLGLVGAASALAAFTVFPLPNPRDMECARETLSDYWVLNPWESFADVAAHGIGFPQVLWSSPMLQLVFNIALFVPFGYFLHVVTRWHWRSSAIAVAVTSVLIELTQGTGFWWAYPCPYRLFDTSDIVVNTLGGVLGIAIASAAMRRISALTPAPEVVQGPVRVRRRVVAALADLFLMYVLTSVILISARIVLAGVWDRATMVEWFENNAWTGTVGSVLGAVVIGLVVPFVRKDGATPGQWILALTPHHVGDPETAPTKLQITKRFFLRWVWWGIDPAQFIAFLLLVADVASVVRRQDRRSFAAVVADTDVRSTADAAAHEGAHELGRP